MALRNQRKVNSSLETHCNSSSDESKALDYRYDGGEDSNTLVRDSVMCGDDPANHTTDQGTKHNYPYGQDHRLNPRSLALLGGGVTQTESDVDDVDGDSEWLENQAGVPRDQWTAADWIRFAGAKQPQSQSGWMSWVGSTALSATCSVASFALRNGYKAGKWGLSCAWNYATGGGGKSEAAMSNFEAATGGSLPRAPGSFVPSPEGTSPSASTSPAASTALVPRMHFAEERTTDDTAGGTGSVSGARRGILKTPAPPEPEPERGRFVYRSPLTASEWDPSRAQTDLLTALSQCTSYYSGQFNAVNAANMESDKRQIYSGFWTGAEERYDSLVEEAEGWLTSERTDNKRSANCKMTDTAYAESITALSAVRTHVRNKIKSEADLTDIGTAINAASRAANAVIVAGSRARDAAERDTVARKINPAGVRG